MTDPAFFGYGSLVNLATHTYADLRPARLQGWRRVWRQTHLRQIAFWSVEPDTNTAIDGIIARVPGADWAALDTREAAYDRHDVSATVLHEGPPATTAIYQVSPHHIAPPGANHPILLSYLDVVVHGYLAVYGVPGVADFFATTAGWDTPILNDRAAPQYPRHQPMTPDQTDLVDRYLATCQVGAAG